MAAHDQAEHLGQGLSASRAAFRKIPEHGVAFVRFKALRHDIHEPPPQADHDSPTTRFAAQETPWLTRVTAL